MRGVDSFTKCAFAAVALVSVCGARTASARKLLDVAPSSAAVAWSPLTYEPPAANAVRASAGDSPSPPTQSSPSRYEIRWSARASRESPPPVMPPPPPPSSQQSSSQQSRSPPPSQQSPPPSQQSPPPSPPPASAGQLAALNQSPPPSAAQTPAQGGTWWLSWSNVERAIPPPPPPPSPPPPPPPQSLTAAIERMDSVAEAKQMADLLATMLVQEDLSPERLTAYSRIAARAFVNYHRAEALEFATEELQSWLFDQALAVARDSDFRATLPMTFASAGSDAGVADISYAVDALIEYQMTERNAAPPTPKVTSASFSALARDVSLTGASNGFSASNDVASSSSSASVDADVRESIARDRLARLVDASLLADPSAFIAALGASSFASSLLADPSLLAYVSRFLGSSDSVVNSFAG